jgi:hypothetical protein
VVYKSYAYSDWVSTGSKVLTASLVAVVCFIAGVAMLIYGAVKKPKQIEEAPAPVAETPPARKRKRRTT